MRWRNEHRTLDRGRNNLPIAILAVIYIALGNVTIATAAHAYTEVKRAQGADSTTVAKMTRGPWLVDLDAPADTARK